MTLTDEQIAELREWAQGEAQILEAIGDLAPHIRRPREIERAGAIRAALDELVKLREMYMCVWCTETRAENEALRAAAPRFAVGDRAHPVRSIPEWIGTVVEICIDANVTVYTLLHGHVSGYVFTERFPDEMLELVPPEGAKDETDEDCPNCGRLGCNLCGRVAS